MSVLPAIKCSTCGQDIEIAFLADHVCTAPSPSQELQPALNPDPPLSLIPGRGQAHKTVAPRRQPSPQPNFDNQQSLQPQFVGRSDRDMPKTGSYLPPTLNPRSPGFSKLGRSIPPRIDPAAANHHFLTVGIQTPGSSYSSSSDTRSTSPVTPSTQLTSPASMMSRKPGIVSRTPTPPSPELQPNLDSAFPPFPPPVPPPARKQSPINSKLRPALLPGDKALVTPLSPRTTGGASAVRKTGTISSGPFARAGGKLEERDIATQELVRPDYMPSNTAAEKQFQPYKKNELVRAPSAAQPGRSHRSTPSDASLQQQGLIASRTSQALPPPPRPSRPTEAVDPFLERMQTDGEPSPESRYAQSDLNGFGDRESPLDPAVQPGFSGPLVQSPLRSAELPVSPRSNPYAWDQNEGPVHPPTTSDPSDHSSAWSNPTPFPEASSTPPVWQVHRQDSDRSVESDVSHATSASSSTVHSAASSRSEWSSNALPDMTRSGSDSRPYGDGRRKRSNTVTSSRSQSLDTASSGAAPHPPRTVWDNLPESPVDPAIQMGLPPPSNREEGHTSPRPERRAAQPLHGGNDLLGATAPQKGKGNCQACRLPIVGKSVKTADGRLPGRYHKACFVCKTCAAPFPTGEFYVLNNSPYCARHYHKLNDSCCKRCDNGIEGSYLETDRREKFHTNCFACTKCMAPLSEDYFEVGARPYCQRHAFSIMRAGALAGTPRQSPERRTTRLMMM